MGNTSVNKICAANSNDDGTTLQNAYSQTIINDSNLIERINNLKQIFVDNQINITLKDLKYIIFHSPSVLDLNKTCNNEDIITFNGENYRQLCSPTIELGRIDSVRFTLSTGKNY